MNKFGSGLNALSRVSMYKALWQGLGSVSATLRCIYSNNNSKNGNIDSINTTKKVKNAVEDLFVLFRGWDRV